MTAVRIHCRVIEVSRGSDDRLHIHERKKGDSSRDLLPWADPYIARLMHILEERYETGRGSADWDDDFLPTHVFASNLSDDAWEHDAFIPRPLERRTASPDPRVFGGYPLLDDTDSEGDTLAL
jgi:hypothetical protein